MDTHDVAAFFESYRHAFRALDAAAIADHFAYPLHVTGEAREIGITAVGERSAWTDQLRHLLGMYREVGFADARFDLLDLAALTPRLGSARLRWTLRDGAGDALYDFSAVYTLARTGEGIRITAIAHDEIPRYRACLQRLRADGRPGPP